MITTAQRLLRLTVVIIMICSCSSAPSVDEMAQRAESLLQATEFDQNADSDQRFAVAAGATGSNAEQLGVYGEFPLRGMAELLAEPHVADVLDRAAGGASFVDFGSGAGRLLLGVAAMRDDWASVVGVEALEQLHAVAQASILSAEISVALKSPGIVRSVHAGVLPHEAPTSELLRDADVCFMYSTAFPSDDGLRLPELSASLASVMREGSTVITTDKLLVGPRFVFEAMLTVQGEDEYETIHSFVWRVSGPPAESYEMALQELYDSGWMDDDACAQSPEACKALLAALGESDEDDD